MIYFRSPKAEAYGTIEYFRSKLHLVGIQRSIFVVPVPTRRSCERAYLLNGDHVTVNCTVELAEIGLVPVLESQDSGIDSRPRRSGAFLPVTPKSRPPPAWRTLKQPR